MAFQEKFKDKMAVVSKEDAHMYFIEMSVVPALTDMSVHACCARAGGMEYPDLVECWLKTASLKSLE